MLNKLQSNYQLQKLNTFNLKSKARYFIAYDNLDALQEHCSTIEYVKLPKLVLGSGSNLLLAGDYNGLVLCPQMKGVEIIEENEADLLVKVGAGVDWDDFVKWSVDRELYGIENLSYIPGNVGASPIQNIGAYGMEVMDVIEQVDGVYIEDFSHATFKNADCNFSYRNSIFKNKLRNKFIVHHVTYRLSKASELITNYGNVKAELDKYAKHNLHNIREVITDIRKSKLPEPEELPNAGSFFKNPIVSNQVVSELLVEFPTAPVYKVSAETAKLAAGWLIDQCGWKGKRVGDAGVHKHQALVLVNYGAATGNDLLRLAEEIIASVYSKFKVKLETEVNIIQSI